MAPKRPSSTQLARKTGPASFKKSRGLPLTPRTYINRTSNRVEVKATSGSSGLTTLLTNGAAYVFGRIDQGVNDDERIGKAVRHTGLEFRFQLTRDPGVYNLCVRVIIGVWKQGLGGGAPPVADLLTTRTILSPINPDSSTMFSIWDDFIINMPCGAGITSAGNIVPVQDIRCFSKKYNRGFVQEYNGASSTDVNNSSHFVCFISQQAAAGVMDFYANNYYTDV